MENENGTVDDNQMEDFSQMVKDYDLKTIDSNSPVEGTIVDIIDDRVIVDIGHKTEGILRKEELYDWDGNLKYSVGDSISVICMNVNLKEGYVTVSKRRLDVQLGWERVVRAYEKELPIMGRINRVVENNKGFMVDMGVEVFLPASQADVKRVTNPQKLLGKEFWFKVHKLNRKEKSGVVSRRDLLEEEKKEKAKKLFEELKVGDLVKGVVTTITDYGAFVNLGGIEGLLHKENISYGRVSHPRKKLRNGDEIETMILEIDAESNKIALGLKQKYPDPWIDIDQKYPVGKKQVAKVTKIVDFGAFIELEEGVEGLLHISDLTWEGKPASVEEYVAVGDKLWVQVIELNGEEKKIKLGLKQLELRPEEKYLQSHKAGEVVNGVVKKILKSRVFIALAENVEGMIRISDITYYRIDHPEEFFNEGDEISVMILDDVVDSNYKVKLGVKQLSNTEWSEFFQKTRSGDVFNVKVKKITEMGINVEISKNIEGFVRSFELDEKKLEPEEVKEKFKIGEDYEAMVIRTDPEKKRVYMSFKGVRMKKERQEIEEYMKSSTETKTTIGDLLQSEIDRKK